jgi:hypothetical protein
VEEKEVPKYRLVQDSRQPAARRKTADGGEGGGGLPQAARLLLESL